jgi:hypothetical protein
MGKSAFAASLIGKSMITDRLLAVFFCKYGQAQRSDGVNIIKSIAYQIVENLPECMPKMKEAGAKLSNSVSVCKFHLRIFHTKLCYDRTRYKH